MMSDNQWLVVAVGCIFIAIFRWWKSARIRVETSCAAVEKTWEYPEPSPNKTFDIQKTFPPRYRAFRYAYRRHTLDIKLLDNNSWVILDNDWPKYHQLKIQRLAERGNRIVQTLSQARTAACELCQDLAEFLSRRYPQVYTIERSRDNALGWYGLGAITRISMSTQGASYDLIKEDPLTVAGLIQPADINILVKTDAGHYQLAAMMLGIGGGQRLKDKLGMSLDELHLSGDIPHYSEQLQRPLNRFLAKLTVEKPIERHTTSISTHDAYHWPEVTMGPEDDWDPKLRGPGVDTPSYGIWKPPQLVTDVSQLFFRQERQTLRRLPKSGAVVWMVHTYIEPMHNIALEPGVPGRLASLVRSWDEKLAEHKGRSNYEHVLLPYLDSLHKKQVELGVCEEGELPSRFPF